MFSMVPCRWDRYYSRPSVATNIASEIHGHSVSFLASASDRWSIRRGLETRYRAISRHNIHRAPLEASCFHVVTGHVLWFRTSKGSEKCPENDDHFGQQLPNTLFSVEVREVASR
ncbi:hypothetical protein TNCV_1654001 [Trichonephila clavipes]|nr:hypothetical protein TNCV_1654001 [Trichonephila clavipes]